MHIWKHFLTITHHKLVVMQGCFKMGLYRQGLMHDLSKYTPTEFFVGAKYYQGDRSPNNAEREDKGFSEAWLHHKGRNKHHFEYWIDYSFKSPDGTGLLPAPMPDRYIAEMFADRLAACKIYNKGYYTSKDALIYYNRGVGKMQHFLHPYTREKLELFLNMLAEKGEDETFRYIKYEFLRRK
ncbi:MAG: DUF5662 family protein [Lachnospiraceae bacterium]|nr:DUF5662 family protein [Lachnospiraceae bacterium]